jgi:hypothetical protein
MLVALLAFTSADIGNMFVVVKVFRVEISAVLSAFLKYSLLLLILIPRT